MADTKKMTKTLSDAAQLVEAADPPPCQLRDMKSAINRVAEMAGMAPAQVEADPLVLRAMLSSILPAAHGVTPKTWANIVSQFRAALRLAGVIDQRSEGLALKDPAWAPLLEAIAEDKRLSCGLAAFANYCSVRAIAPPQVDDLIVQQFHSWLESRTLCPKPHDVVRRVPHLWNEASEKIEVWPKVKLTTLSSN